MCSQNQSAEELRRERNIKARPINLFTEKGRQNMALIYTLAKQCLTDVKDPAGFWQIEGGNVLQDKEPIATYSSVRRVDCGTTELKTSMLWTTLFFLKGKPPENITLHGAHDLASSSETGSVSAASPAFAAHIGKQFTRVANTLTIA
jgi:hypothetical protein